LGGTLFSDRGGGDGHGRGTDGKKGKRVRVHRPKGGGGGDRWVGAAQKGKWEHGDEKKGRIGVECGVKGRRRAAGNQGWDKFWYIGAGNRRKKRKKDKTNLI